MNEAQETGKPANTASGSKRFRSSLVPITISAMAIALVVLINGNWTAWSGSRIAQTTDDAYVRADLTPLSTKVAGLVASVEVADYQTVKAGDLLVRLQDADFHAQVEEAEAAVQSGKSSLVDNQREKELQDARIEQAMVGVSTANADIAAAEAGIDAAKSSEANARAALAAIQADVQRTSLERKRQEALFVVESTTHQILEQAVASERSYWGQQGSKEAEVSAATAQLSSRQADLNRAKASLEKSRVEVEVQRRQRAVLEAQALVLRADVSAKIAALDLARTNLNYTRIVAPEDGVVGERKVRAGQLVSPGTQVLSLVQHQVWVQANYKEDQLRNIRDGDPAEVRIDAFPGIVAHGKVARISPASGSQFALLPPDNATGNFTKIMQRVPVKIVLDDPRRWADKLRPGLSVVATIRTRAGVN